MKIVNFELISCSFLELPAMYQMGQKMDFSPNMLKIQKGVVGKPTLKK